ncbi:MAG TPA: antibiotic biosynthesis monooxygenase family protein [Chloroflexota bacterium]|jgi:heme-degrading monooxygenase HmoA|nr:antibiotic biosynthesis monooxygenase family protein [Chloroflexota bacterium]
MAIQTTADLPALTKEQYDSLANELIPQIKAMPGFIAHVGAHLEGGGYRITEVWESREAFERWIRDSVLPVNRRLGIVPGPGQILDVDILITP